MNIVGRKEHRQAFSRVVIFTLGAVFMLTIQTFWFGIEWSILPRPNSEPRLKPATGNISHVARSTDFTVDPSVQSIYDEIDNEDNKARCARYGFEYKPRDAPRRIFFGSLIADDSLHTLLIHATETYGIYDTVSLVESNLTQTMTERPLRYSEGSERLEFIQSGIFGSATRVHVDFFFNDTLQVMPLLRERIQREMIIERWRENGMTTNDIGIISDIDETFSRDVLRAAQVCDIPSLRPGQDCHTPKLIGETLIFESSPECMQKNRRWIHPDMIIGECIQGIGNATLHPLANRQLDNKGLRRRGYGQKRPSDYLDSIVESGKYPLWNAADYRETDGGQYIEWKGPREKGRTAAYVTAFHFHNFFDDFATLRNKYLTYGHPRGDAMSKPLSKLHADIDVVVRCIRDMPNSNTTVGYGDFVEASKTSWGPNQSFFETKPYRLLRHASTTHGDRG